VQSTLEDIMRPTADKFVFWAPRVAGLLMAGFLALFALDALTEGTLVQRVVGLLIHLVPAALVLIVVAIAWRFEWVGALAFGALAIGYGMMVNWRLDWVAVIGGPLALIAVLFLVSWRQRRGLVRSAH
jgi:hypothetical protein